MTLQTETQFSLNALSPNPFCLRLEDGSFFVVDEFQHCIVHLNSRGHIMKVISGPGQEPENLHYPRGLALQENNLYLCDSWNHRVAVFDLEGRFVRSFGSFGGGEGQFTSPCDLCFDDSGLLWIADQGNNRVVVFHLEHGFQRVISGIGPGAVHPDSPLQPWAGGVRGFAGDQLPFSYPNRLRFKNGVLYLLDNQALFAFGPDSRLFRAKLDHAAYHSFVHTEPDRVLLFNSLRSAFSAVSPVYFSADQSDPLPEKMSYLAAEDETLFLLSKDEVHLLLRSQVDPHPPLPSVSDLTKAMDAHLDALHVSLFAMADLSPLPCYPSAKPLHAVYPYLGVLSGQALTGETANQKGVLDYHLQQLSTLWFRLCQQDEKAAVSFFTRVERTVKELFLQRLSVLTELASAYGSLGDAIGNKAVMLDFSLYLHAQSIHLLCALVKRVLGQVKPESSVDVSDTLRRLSSLAGKPVLIETLFLDAFLQGQLPAAYLEAFPINKTMDGAFSAARPFLKEKVLCEQYFKSHGSHENDYDIKRAVYQTVVHLAENHGFFILNDTFYAIPKVQAPIRNYLFWSLWYGQGDDNAAVLQAMDALPDSVVLQKSFERFLNLRYQGRHEEAVKLLKSEKYLYPSTMGFLAHSQLLSGDAQGAIATLRSPAFTESRSYHLGMIAWFQEDLLGAAKWFQKEREEVERNHVPLIMLSLVSLLEGEPEQLDGYLKQLQGRVSGVEFKWFQALVCSFSAGPADALRLLEPEDCLVSPSLSYLKGQCLRRCGRYQDALDFFETAFARFADWPHCLQAILCAQAAGDEVSLRRYRQQLAPIAHIPLGDQQVYSGDPSFSSLLASIADQESFVDQKGFLEVGTQTHAMLRLNAFNYHVSKYNNVYFGFP